MSCLPTHRPASRTHRCARRAVVRVAPFRVLVAAAITVAVAAAGSPLRAQRVPAMPATPATQPAAEAAKAPKAPKVPPIYEALPPLTVTLRADLDRLRKDQDEDAPWRPASLSYLNDMGDTVRVPLRARTRGIWRLHNCEFPPLRLNFRSDSVKTTLFARLDEPKLVNYCRNSSRYEEYVLQEYQLYRIYNLLTPYSHRVRLLRASYADADGGKVRATRWAFLLEEPDALAHRIGADRIELKGVGPSDVDPYQHVLYAVFQYMIGNTDWSVGALHNVGVFFKDGAYMAVAYDFDYSGAVDAQYAVPDPSLHLTTVRNRLYRGYCVGDEPFADVFALFNARKDAIYALYRDEAGSLLQRGTAERTLRYFDEFYKTINNPRTAKQAIMDQCLGRR